MRGEENRGGWGLKEKLYFKGMKSQSLYVYYQFGFNYHILLRSGQNFSNKELYDNLIKYLLFIEQLSLFVTKASVDLNHIVPEIENTLKELAEDPEKAEEVVDKKVEADLRKKLNIVDNVLDAELCTKMGFILDEKISYSIETLTSRIERLFADGTYAMLPPISQEDYKEAGLCLAFDRYTASAFHALRGTEEVLKFYASKLLNKAPGLRATWGSSLKSINTKINSKGLTPSPSLELMTNLELLRDYHRNKTQHPVRTYSQDQALDLLGVCAKSANEIIADLKKRNLL